MRAGQPKRNPFGHTFSPFRYYFCLRSRQPFQITDLDHEADMHTVCSYRQRSYQIEACAENVSAPKETHILRRIIAIECDDPRLSIYETSWHSPGLKSDNWRRVNGSME